MLTPVALHLHARWLVLAATALAPCAAHAQTADPTAIAPNPITAAPTARAGSYTLVQGNLVVAPGLAIPNGNLPWALDTTQGTPALVPIHHSSITEPANVNAPGAPDIATHTLDGAHAKTVLRTTDPVFFLHTNDRTENTGDAGRGNPTGWALVGAASQGSNRTIPHVHFDQIAQGAACAAPVVCLKAESLPDGWLRLSASSPLAAGEYALVPVPRQARPGVVVLYDFTVDPAAPLAKDAARPATAAPAPTAHAHHR